MTLAQSYPWPLHFVSDSPLFCIKSSIFLFETFCSLIRDILESQKTLIDINAEWIIIFIYANGNVSEYLAELIDFADILSSVLE